MKCIFFHDLQRLPDSDCLVKYHLSHRHEKIISLFSRIVIDVVYKKHVCLHLGRVPELRTCVKVVRLDLRRSFHLSLRTVEEKIFFMEIVNQFVRYISIVRHKIARTVNVDINQALEFTRPDQPQKFIIDQGYEPVFARSDEDELEESRRPMVESQEQKQESDFKRFVHMEQIRSEIAVRMEHRSTVTPQSQIELPTEFSFDLSIPQPQEQETDQPELEAVQEEPEETEEQEPILKPALNSVGHVPVTKGKYIDMDKLNEEIHKRFNSKPAVKSSIKIPPRKYNYDENDEEESQSSEPEKQPVAQNFVGNEPVKQAASTNDNGEQVVSFSFDDLMKSNDAGKKQLAEQLAKMFKKQTGESIDQPKVVAITQEKQEHPKENDSTPEKTQTEQVKEEPQIASVTYHKKPHVQHTTHTKKSPIIHEKIAMKPISVEGESKETATNPKDSANKDIDAKTATLRREDKEDKREDTSSDKSDSKTSKSQNQKSPEAKKKENSKSSEEESSKKNTDANKNASPSEEKPAAKIEEANNQQPPVSDSETKAVTVSKKHTKPIEKKDNEEEESKKDEEESKNLMKPKRNALLIPETKSTENETMQPRQTNQIREIHITVELPKAKGSPDTKPDQKAIPAEAKKETSKETKPTEPKTQPLTSEKKPVHEKPTKPLRQKTPAKKQPVAILPEAKEQKQDGPKPKAEAKVNANDKKETAKDAKDTKSAVKDAKSGKDTSKDAKAKAEADSANDFCNYGFAIQTAITLVIGILLL